MRFTQELYSELKEVLRSLLGEMGYLVNIYYDKVIIGNTWNLTTIYSSLKDEDQLNKNRFHHVDYKYGRSLRKKNGRYFSVLPSNMILIILIIFDEHDYKIIHKRLSWTKKRSTPEQILQEIQGTWERLGFLQFSLNSDWIDIKFNY